MAWPEQDNAGCSGERGGVFKSFGSLRFGEPSRQNNGVWRMSICLEGSLRKPVAEWIITQGMTPVFEVRLSGQCDVVGFEFEPKLPRVAPKLKRVIAIELKLEDVADVLRQAKSNSCHVDLSYAAMPFERVGRMKESTLNQFRDSGVGLLSVSTSGRVDLVIPARTNTDESMQWKRSALCRTGWRRREEWIRRVDLVGRWRG